MQSCARLAQPPSSAWQKRGAVPPDCRSALCHAPSAAPAQPQRPRRTPPMRGVPAPPQHQQLPVSACPLWGRWGRRQAFRQRRCALP